MKPTPVVQPQAGTVLIVTDTYIEGRHVRKGTVVTTSGTNLSLLREANRCVDFDPDNAEHRAALEATRKAERAAQAAGDNGAEAAAQAEKEAIAAAEKAAEEAAAKAAKAGKK